MEAIKRYQRGKIKTKTILLEGTELSGKTTLAENLRKRLENEGFYAILNSGPINKSSKLIDITLEVANRVTLPSFRELLYTISLLADHDPREVYSQSDFFIQERYFPSVIAYSRVFNLLGVNRYFGNYLRKQYLSFDINILVKTSLETRLERIKERKEKTRLDDIIEKRPEISIDLEKEIRRVLCKERGYFEINTDEMDVDEATEEVYRRLI